MNKSFTLIEILVVIVVVGILSSFILVGMSSITSNANITKSKAFSNSLDNTLLLNRVSQWKLDDTSGTSAFDSWLTNTGTLTNFADTSSGYGDTHDSGWMSSTNCISGTCLKFDGTNDYINCGSGQLDLTGNALTLSVWMLWESYVSWDRIVSKEAGVYLGYTLYGRDTGGLTFRMNLTVSGDSMLSYNNSIGYNKWHHVVGTYDGSYMNLYLDGNRLLAPTAKSGNLQSSGTNLNIGKNSSASGSYFNGIIDDVRIYNQAVSFSQIQENYYFGLNKLVSNYNINKEEFAKRIFYLKSSIGKKII